MQLNEVAYSTDNIQKKMDNLNNTPKETEQQPSRLGAVITSAFIN
jgi:hypothetical protein